MREKKNIKGIIFLGILTLGLIIAIEYFICNNGLCSATQDVMIITDKKEYKQQAGEIVYVTITNNSKNDIYIDKSFSRPLTSLFIEHYLSKDKRWAWCIGFTVEESYSDNYSASDWIKKAARLNPGQSIIIQYGIEVFMATGRYRFRLDYYESNTSELPEIKYDKFRNLHFKTVYSNEFASKETLDSFMLKHSP